jgi:hypothetical protein
LKLQKIRSFSSVLFKRFALQQGAQQEVSNYTLIGGEARARCEAFLLLALEKETALDTRRKICYAIADLSRHLAEKGAAWTELITSTILVI